MKLNYKIFTTLSVGLLSILIYSGCKKYENPPPVFEELKDLTTKQRKVLVISIDGLSGEELQAIAPPTIMSLQKNSKYSFKTNPTVSDAGGWASMMTGTSHSKHQTSNDSFERTEDGSNHDHDAIVVYRNVLDYVTQYKAVTTAMVTPWASLRHFMRIADFAPIVTSDVAVKDSTLQILDKQFGLGAVFVNFKDAEVAGEAGGYVSATNANYKNAVLKADEYVAALVEGLKKRKNYANEDWLVVITTSHGGSRTSPQAGFTIVHHPDFKEFELTLSGFNGALFSTKDSRAVVPNDNGLYDVGATKSITVQMDTRFNTTNVNYPTFLGKSTNLNGGTITGWQWGHYGDEWSVTVGGSANGGTGKNQYNAPTRPGTAWHTLTMTINTTVNGQGVATARTLSLYMDGKLETSTDILGKKSLTTTEALRVGHRPGDTDTPTPFIGANLTIFNVALDEETIKAHYNIKNITEHPKYANLIGFWPMSEGVESTFANKAPGGYNMSLSGEYKWTNLAAAYPPGTTPVPVTSTISVQPIAGDVAALTLYWLKIPIRGDFNYDGVPYLKNFEIEFLK